MLSVRGLSFKKIEQQILQSCREIPAFRAFYNRQRHCLCRSGHYSSLSDCYATKLGVDHSCRLLRFQC